MHSKTFGQLMYNNTEFNLLKSDDEKRLVFGWASVSIHVNGEQLIDHQGDMIDPDDLEDMAYTYVLEFRDSGEEHRPNLRQKAKMVESCVFTEEKQHAIGIPPGIIGVGWWVGFKVHDDAAWEKIKSGQYSMFSIQGTATRIPVE